MEKQYNPKSATPHFTICLTPYRRIGTGRPIYCGIIYIQTIDKIAFDFFDQLDKQKLAQFNPLVEQLFLRDGQFGKKAVGYFSAMVKSNPALYIFIE